MNIVNIKNFQNILNNNIKNINKKIIKRERKIDFRHILYGSIYKSVNNTSFDTVTYQINKIFIDKNVDKTITKTSFIKKKNNIDPKYFLEINNSIIDYIYKKIKNPRIIGVDGSFLNLHKNFNEYGYEYASDNKNYCKAIISCIYDIENKIPINYYLFKQRNERDAFKQQIKYLRKGDIVIFDRGYFSYDIIDILNNKGINYIFRLKNNKKEVTHLINNNLKEYIFKYKNIDNKVVHYNIDDLSEDYYLYTNLIHKSIDELKDLYWKRWCIETHFKESKYNLALNNINLKTDISLQQEIYIHNLIFILYYFFNFENTCIIKNKYKLNNKTGIKIFSEDILYLFIFNKLTKSCFEKIKKFHNLMLMSVIYIPQSKKRYERKRLRPYGKWYFNKNKI
jgi:hypothetical protein